MRALRRVFALVVVSSLVDSSIVHAELPALDASAVASPGRSTRVAIERLRDDPTLARLGRVASVDERFGTPSIVWATGERIVTPGVTTEQSARNHLARLAPLYGLSAADVRDAILRRVHDTGRGGIIATFGRAIDGVEVFREEVKVMMRRDGSLVAVSGSIPSGAEIAGAAARTFRLDAPEAIARALSDFASVPVPAASARLIGTREGGYTAYDVSAARDAAGAALAGEPMRAKRVWFRMPDGPVPGWYTEVIGATEAYAYVVSAADGTLLFRNSLMSDDAFTYRVWADASGIGQPYDGPQGVGATPHPAGYPNLLDPGFVPPNAVTLAYGPISTHDPWLPPGAVETTGNNVDAYADIQSPDGYTPGDLRPTITAPNVFDRVYDMSLQPNANPDQRKASATQLFYTVNFLHDWFYDHGFDEASGNGQLDNYGRGGLAGDPIHAEAQDYGSLNNANMATPADGAPPRMQVYIWVPPTASVTATGFGWLANGTASFGPQAFLVTGDLVEGLDAVAPVTDGCTALVNPVAGKIVLVDRGNCNFDIQAVAAQNAGAIGVLIANFDNSVFNITGGSLLSIPTMLISSQDGAALRAALAGGAVTVSMQRFSSGVRHDGALDNQLIAHEWGHYLSNRLIGNAAGLSTTQSKGMGEGWGDFIALLLTAREGDNFLGTYGFSGLPWSFPGPTNAYYFGIRRLPYSIDFDKNALTFGHIANGAPLPVGPPIWPNGGQNAEVHNTGEVWCTMLWGCMVNLIYVHGAFTDARERMMDYLVAGMKMTPLAPTFTEARDAMLMAAAANDLLDYLAFYAAFAFRGIGVGAVPPPRFSTDNVGVIESFAVGGDLAFVSAELTDDVNACDSDGILDNGETGSLTVALRNVGATSLAATTGQVTSTNPAVSFPGTNQIVFSPSDPTGLSSGSVQVKLAGAAGVSVEDFHITWTDPDLVSVDQDFADLAVLGNADELFTNVETAEARTPTWTFEQSGVPGSLSWTRKALSPTNHVFFAPDNGVASQVLLISPPLEIQPGFGFTFSFMHRYEFESSGGNDYDGGVVEVSTDDGATWSDIGPTATPGYNGTIYTGSGNPLSGRPAFCATNPSWPEMDSVSVNLGPGFGGQTVRVRFRLGTDAAAGAFGWEIDDLSFWSIGNAPFLGVVAEPDVCAPTAVDGSPPGAWSLSLAGANPVAGAAVVRFALPGDGRVDLSVFDVSGRRVATLAKGEYPAGVHEATWGGGGAPAGVYFVRMVAAGRTFQRRVVRLP